MKRILLALCLVTVTSLSAFSQDTLRVTNLTLQARDVEYLTPTMINPENDSLYTTFLAIRNIFRTANPTGTTTLVIPEIPTLDLANMYHTILGSPAGNGIDSRLKTALASARSANPYLARLMTMSESFWQDRVIQQRRQGRRMLKGNDN